MSLVRIASGAIAVFCLLGEATAQQPPQPEGTLPELQVTPDAGGAVTDPATTGSSSQDIIDRLYPRLSTQGGRLFDDGVRSGRSILEAAAHETIVDRVQLEERAPRDMFQALEREVGVLLQRTQRGAAAPFIRGLTGPQVLILVDGIRMNNATFRLGPNQYFNTIDPGMVERIEVIRGPQAVLYGADAIGGVINVITRSASNRFSADYYGGQWVNRVNSADLGYYSRLNFEGSTSTYSLFGGAGYANFNNLDRGGNLGRQPWTDYSHYSGDMRFDYLISELSMLTVSFQQFSQQDVARSDRFPNRLTVFDPQQRSMVYVRYQGLSLSPVFDQFMVTASYQRQREGTSDIRAGSTNLDIGEVDNHSYGMSFLFSSDWQTAGRLTYGADLYHDDVASLNNRFDTTSGTLVGPRTPKYPDDGIYNQVGAFVEWGVELNACLSAVTGVRYTRVTAFGTPIVDVDHDNNPGTPPLPTPVTLDTSYQDWSASAGLNYKVSDNVHLVGSFAEGFRAPNLDDLAATNDNVQQSSVDTPSLDLRPERSRSYDVGVKVDGSRWRGQVYYFWMDIDDMILRTPGGMVGTDTLFSRSNRDSHINGLEAGGEYLLADGWSLYGNFSYYLGQDKVRLEPLSRIPPTQGVLGLRWRSENGSFIDAYGWFVRRQDRLNFQDVSDSRIPPGGTPGFGIFSVRCGTYLDECQRVTIGIENLLDRAYRVHGSGVDGSGISASLGYEWLY